MKFLFHFEASPEIGGGHAIRCQTLANALQAKGAEIDLLTSPETLEMVPDLVQDFYHIGFIGMMDHLQPPYDWAVIDMLDADSSIDQQFKHFAKKRLIISDNPTVPRDCEMLLDSNFGRLTSDYRGLLPTEKTEVLAGSDYILLKPFDLTAKLQDKNSILISVGYADHKMATVKYLNALSGIGCEFPIDIVIGYGPDVVAACAEIVEKSGLDASIHVQPSNLPEIYGRSYLALGAGGASIWERAVFNIPTITMELAENQHHLLNKLNQEKAVMHLGQIEDISEMQISIAVQKMFSDTALRKNYATRIHGLCDGLGVQRVTDKLLSSQ